MVTFDELNDTQRQAVLGDSGPVLALGGPGTGKTTVLTHRFVHLLSNNAKAGFLALTVTDRAAEELSQRVRAHLAPQSSLQYYRRKYYGVNIHTFQTFADNLLKRYAYLVGMQSNRVVTSQGEDRAALLEDAIRASGHALELPDDRHKLLQSIDRLFAVPLDEQKVLLRGPLKRISPLYRHYWEWLIANNCMDSNGLIRMAIRFMKMPAVARVVHICYSNVCVDEFQDVNSAQYDLLRLVAPARDHKLLVVSDDDQNSYQWNGANPKRFRDLARDYDIEQMRLPECYHSPKSIVAGASRLFALDSSGDCDKRLVRVRGNGASGELDVVRVHAFDSLEEEATFVVQDMEARSRPPAECVVLGRTVRLVRDAAKVLQQHEVNAHVVASRRTFDSPILTTVIEALRLANSPGDGAALRRLCLSWEGATGLNINPRDVVGIAGLQGGDLLRAWKQRASEKATGQAKEVLQRIKASLIERKDHSMLVDWVLSDDGALLWTEEPLHNTAEEVMAWKALDGAIHSKNGSDITLNSYLQQFDLSPEEIYPGPDALRCMTIHGAKGIDFKHVYLIGMVQELFPSWRAVRQGADSPQMNQERHSCFVAITRAEETVTLTRSRQYYGCSKPPSQFIEELGFLSDTETQETEKQAA